jgi:hypothetical protein
VSRGTDSPTSFPRRSTERCSPCGGNSRLHRELALFLAIRGNLAATEHDDLAFATLHTSQRPGSRFREPLFCHVKWVVFVFDQVIPNTAEFLSIHIEKLTPRILPLGKSIRRHHCAKGAEGHAIAGKARGHKLAGRDFADERQAIVGLDDLSRPAVASERDVFCRASEVRENRNGHFAPMQRRKEYELVTASPE